MLFVHLTPAQTASRLNSPSLNMPPGTQSSVLAIWQASISKNTNLFASGLTLFLHPHALPHTPLPLFEMSGLGKATF
jgi:hypothetical protein